MHRLVWLLLAGCSSASNTTPAEPADPSASPCTDGPLPSYTDCPASFSPARDLPEQLCGIDGVSFFVGSAAGYPFVWTTRSDGYTECYYDPSSGAFVGLVESAAPNYRCTGIVPQVDAEEADSITHVTCPNPAAAR